MGDRLGEAATLGRLRGGGDLLAAALDLVAPGTGFCSLRFDLLLEALQVSADPSGIQAHRRARLLSHGRDQTPACYHPRRGKSAPVEAEAGASRRRASCDSARPSTRALVARDKIGSQPHGD